MTAKNLPRKIRAALHDVLGSAGEGFGCDIPMDESAYERMLDMATDRVMHCIWTAD